MEPMPALHSDEPGAGDDADNKEKGEYFNDSGICSHDHPRDRGALRTIVYLFLCEYRVFLVSKENGKMFQEKDCLFSDHGGYPGTCKGREIDLAPAVVGIMVVSIGQKLIDLPSGIGHSEHGFRSKTL